MKKIDKKMNYTKLSNNISSWLKDYVLSNHLNGFILGVSGGIDSAVVSALCASTGKNLLILEMPIHQGNDEVLRAKKHIQWLKDKYPNVTSLEINLTDTYDMMHEACKHQVIPVTDEQYEFSMANTRSRLRMTTLYQYAGTHKLLVVGTGNKVEDFGIGFFTKYGDGGVDISPIADLMKSEVYALGAELGINNDILTAAPTDGLHTDGRTDEDQIGASYDELEWAMSWISNHIEFEPGVGSWYDASEDTSLSERQCDVLKIYSKFNSSNKHKMNSIPTFKTYKFRNNG